MTVTGSKQEEKKSKKEGKGGFYDDSDEGKWAWLGLFVCYHRNVSLFYFCRSGR